MWQQAKHRNFTYPVRVSSSHGGQIRYFAVETQAPFRVSSVKFCAVTYLHKNTHNVFNYALYLYNMLAVRYPFNIQCASNFIWRYMWITDIPGRFARTISSYVNCVKLLR